MHFVNLRDFKNRIRKIQDERHMISLSKLHSEFKKDPEWKGCFVKGSRFHSMLEDLPKQQDEYSSDSVIILTLINCSQESSTKAKILFEMMEPQESQSGKQMVFKDTLGNLDLISHIIYIATESMGKHAKYLNY